MTYNEQLADRVREMIAATENNIVEKRMFGGLCFMVNDKMLAGIESERMMLRVGPDAYEEALEKEGCTPMDFTGKVMKGYVFVDADALATNKQLSWWIGITLKFNKVAKASKKKTPAAAKSSPGKQATKSPTASGKQKTSNKHIQPTASTSKSRNKR
ncbi:TfoX/Sxy family protein [Paraflavitalea pollutisoli]|uniref:TfoX/Sxy family protein n=1 Tax=Paraflavitalea pollutisoli TaxID=3034143 RepID=UPI0023EB9391|nr:TfoX/Sxy family protein [Paraflavitalea sp. H1-2-19X]